MQVWQLMGILAKCRADAEVSVAHNADSPQTNIATVVADADDDCVMINGSGEFIVTEEHESGEVE